MCGCVVVCICVCVGERERESACLLVLVAVAYQLRPLFWHVQCYIICSIMYIGRYREFRKKGLEQFVAK